MKAHIDKLNERNNFIDEIFEFEGLWGLPSKCGLKIIENNDKKIVIITELYDENEGCSITELCALVVTKLCNEKNLEFKETTFIQHNPDVGSKLEFYKEVFDIIHLSESPSGLKDPSWERISKDEVLALINK